jgi:hypothetical protein
VSVLVCQDPAAASALTFSLWDFAGQEVFYELHHLFLTSYGVYCLLFNMEWIVTKPGDMRQECVKRLRFWLNSITAHTASVNERGRPYFAPVFLLGTHKDKVPEAQQHKMVSDLLAKEFKDLLVWHSVQKYSDGGLCFYPIDNLKGRKDGVVRHVMERVHKLVKMQSYVKAKVPFPWLLLLDKMQEGGAGAKRSFMRLADVHRMARELGYHDVTLEEIGKMLELFNQVILAEWIRVVTFAVACKCCRNTALGC